MAKVFISVMDKPMSTKGFTMIESLFVILIMCILFTISTTVHIPQKTEQMIIKEISQFLNEAKLTAMTVKEDITISFDQSTIIYQNDHIFQQLSLDEETQFETYELTFNAMGHIDGAKSIHCTINNNDHTFVYQLGCGYFYVQ